MRNAFWWPVIIIVSALTAGTLTLLDAVPPARVAIGLWFLLVCPGMAYVRLLQIKEDFFELILAIALSIAINTVVSQALLVTNNWSPRGGLLIVIAISITGATLQLALPNNRRLDAQRQKKQGDNSVPPPLRKCGDRCSPDS